MGAGLSNFLWLTIDRSIRLTVAIGVGSWTARYLGARDFGLINYALALIAMFTAASTLGMEQLAVREIIKDEKKAGVWLGTVIGFRVITTIVCLLLCIVTTCFLRGIHDRATLLVSILASGTILQSLESGELLFQARTQMRRLIIPRLVLFTFINIIKITLIIKGCSVVYFASLTSVELTSGGVLTLSMLIIALGKENKLKIDFQQGIHLISKSWPLALSGLSIVVYMRVGMVILGSLLGDKALGIYAAAIRVPESINFMPMILASSMLPSLLKKQLVSIEEYNKGLLKYFRVNVLISLLVCIPLSLGAPLIIHFLYKNAYASAAPVMAVYVWSLLFIFLGVARSQCLINEHRTRISMLFSVSGLAINIACNYILIPKWGIMGAAFATLLAQMGSAFLISFLIPSTKSIAKMQLRALFTPWHLFDKAVLLQLWKYRNLKKV